MIMKKFFVDYSAYCEIEAETPDEATNIFWRFIDEGKVLPAHVLEIDSVEEAED